MGSLTERKSALTRVAWSLRTGPRGRSGSGSRSCRLKSPPQLSPPGLGLPRQTLLHSLPASLTPDPLPRRPSSARPLCKAGQWPREQALGAQREPMRAPVWTQLALRKPELGPRLTTRGDASASQSGTPEWGCPAPGRRGQWEVQAVCLKAGPKRVGSACCRELSAGQRRGAGRPRAQPSCRTNRSTIRTSTTTRSSSTGECRRGARGRVVRLDTGGRGRSR